jgi:hypothetical protein
MSKSTFGVRQRKNLPAIAINHPGRLQQPLAGKRNRPKHLAESLENPGLAACAIRSRQMPGAFGVHGPGESTSLALKTAARASTLQQCRSPSEQSPLLGIKSP